VSLITVFYSFIFFNIFHPINEIYRLQKQFTCALNAFWFWYQWIDLHVYETRSLILMAEHKVQAFKKKSAYSGKHLDLRSWK
jgi:hypothetical protein